MLFHNLLKFTRSRTNSIVSADMGLRPVSSITSIGARLSKGDSTFDSPIQSAPPGGGTLRGDGGPDRAWSQGRFHRPLRRGHVGTPHHGVARSVLKVRLRVFVLVRKYDLCRYLGIDSGENCCYEVGRIRPRRAGVFSVPALLLASVRGARTFLALLLLASSS